LSAYYAASKEKDPKTGRRRTILRAMMAIDGHALQFADTADGKKELKLKVMATAYDMNDREIASRDNTFDTAVGVEEMTQLTASGLVYNTEVDIAAPGAYQLRVAAWDANAKRAGSATSFVEIPDFNREGMVLSSVQVFDSDAKRNEALTRAGVLGAGSPITRVFAPGAVLQYDCTVYGAAADRVDIAVRVLRGAEQVLMSGPGPLAGGDANLAAIRASGRIQLPANLPPGDYSLEIKFEERMAKGNSRNASQWVDFTVAQ
jgi:hypothetical protein